MVHECVHTYRKNIKKVYGKNCTVQCIFIHRKSYGDEKKKGKNLVFLQSAGACVGATGDAGGGVGRGGREEKTRENLSGGFESDRGEGGGDGC